MRKKRVLVVDDDASLRVLQGEKQFEIDIVADGHDGLGAFARNRPDLVITSLKMRELDGSGILENVKKANPQMPIIVLTAGEELKDIIGAMRLGAHAFIEKPLNIPQLKLRIAEALQLNNTSAAIEIDKLDHSGDEEGSHVIVGNSIAMIEIFEKIGRLSSSKVNVLIQGESGTGKHLIARVIHDSGPTRGLPFIVIDSSAWPETILERYLFGRLEGANPDAKIEMKGTPHLANEGTIFLVHISELPLRLQGKLLRSLEEREFERTGDGVIFPMKARIIAATHKNLDYLVRCGKFRHDLLYRISGVTINIPPLRERKEDIPELAAHFIKRTNRELHKGVK